MTEEAKAFVHPIFIHDPEEWMQYVYKKVSVVTKEGKEHEGWVYTIDPVTQNIVLMQFVDEKTEMSIIMNHAINKTTILAESDPGVKDKLDALFRPEPVMKSSGELRARKLKLKAWFNKNRLPSELTDQEEVLSVADGALTIHPPYGVNDCVCFNTIILGRIQGLMKNMPEDQDEW